MELLDFAEQQGQEAAKFSLATLEQARARCHQFLVLLLGGAGAFAGVGLTQWGAYRWVGAAALAVALWWFAVAAWVALRGLRSSPVRSWARQGVTVVEMHTAWQAYSDELIKEQRPGVDVLQAVRQEVLRSMRDSADEYRAASTYAALALDQAYIATALTLVPLLSLALMAVYFG